MTDETTSDSEVYAFQFYGTWKGLLALAVKNTALTLLTLGLYFPWAKTNMRRYLWNNLELAGGAMRYTGTAREILRGYLVVLSFWGAVGGLAHYLEANFIEGWFLLRAGVGVGFLFVLPWVIYKARAYLLSRTQWNGVALGMKRGATPFMAISVLGWIGVVFTLGLAFPIRQYYLMKHLTENTLFGSMSLRFTGKKRDLVKCFFKALVFTPLTMGIYYFWYRADVLQYQAKNTWLDSASGEFKLKGSDLFCLGLLKAFLVVFTLGLALPWFNLYQLQVFSQNLVFRGKVRFEEISAAPQDSSGAGATGNGAADFFGIDVAA